LKSFQRSGKAQLAGVKGFLQVLEKQAAEQTGQHAHRKKEMGSAGNPAGLVGGESAAGDDAMQMRMKDQSLPPGVKDGEKTDLGAEMLGVGRNSLQGVGGGPEENTVDNSLVLKGDGGNLLWYSKNDVKIGNVQKLRFSILDPLGARQRLTLRTVPIRARVAPDALVAATVTDLDMAAQSGRAAQLDGAHHAPVCGR
jgi:hypothetical protein